MAKQTNTSPPLKNGGHTYRLQEISVVKKCLEDDRDKRASLYKKYHHGNNVLDVIDFSLTSAVVYKMVVLDH